MLQLTDGSFALKTMTYWKWQEVEEMIKETVRKRKAEPRSPESLEADAGWTWEAESAIGKAVKQNRKEKWRVGGELRVLCALKTSAGTALSACEAITVNQPIRAQASSSP